MDSLSNTAPSQFASTLTSAEVNNALAGDLDLWAALAGVQLVKRSGKEYGIKGDASVSINFTKGKGQDFSGKHTSGNLVTIGASLSGEHPEGFADKVRQALGFPKWGEPVVPQPSQQAKSAQRRPITQDVTPLPHQAERQAEEAKALSQRIAKAQSIARAFPRIINDTAQGICPYWAHIESRAPHEPDDNYIATRKLDPDDWRACERFNFSVGDMVPQYHKALISMVRNHHTGEATGFQAVAIDEQGAKAWAKDAQGKPFRKKTIGVRKGAGVYLTQWGRLLDPQENPDQVLGICEGWETGLGLTALGVPHVCACLSADGVAAFPIIQGIKRLLVFADGDQAGLKASKQVQERYERAGVLVEVHPGNYSPPCQDGHDVIQAGCET